MPGFPKKTTANPEDLKAQQDKLRKVRLKLREGVTRTSWEKGGNYLQTKINEYYALCDQINAPYTYPGLAVYLGCNDTSELSKKKKVTRYAAVLARAKTVIEAEMVTSVVDRDTKNSKGIEFVLVNNYGYKIKPDMTMEHTIEIKRPPKKVAGAHVKCGQRVDKEVSQ